MYRHLRSILEPYIHPGETLAISRSQRLCWAVGLDQTSVHNTSFPQVDMLSLPHPDSTFDFVLTDQVLEHVRGDPHRAVEESLRVLKPGGIAVHTSCLLNPIHRSPDDYWRFTPFGLVELCSNFGVVIDAGGWGNKFVWLAICAGLRFEDVPESRWHPYRRLALMNDPQWPISTWVVAQK